jgi:plastocyanin domain-containing protein
VKKVYIFGLIIWIFGSVLGIILNKDKPGSSKTSQTTPVTINVTAKGYVPNNIELQSGAPIKIDFKNAADSGCLSQIKSSELKLDSTNLAVGDNYITLKDLKPGVYHYGCGMNMAGGTITIK